MSNNSREDVLTPQTENDRLMMIFCFLSIFCIAIRFFQLISITYNQLDMHFDGTLTILDIIFQKQGVHIPVDIIVDIMLVFTGAYSGVETSVSVIKSRNMPIGEAKPVPLKKRRRMWHIVDIWVAQTVGTTALYILLGKNNITDFDLMNTYIGLFVVVAAMIGICNASNMVADTENKIGKNKREKDENGCEDPNISALNSINSALENAEDAVKELKESKKDIEDS